MTMFKNKKKLILTSLSVLVASTGLFFWQIKPTLSKKDDLQTTTVKQENLKKTLSVSGEIEAEEKATLRFQTSGRLAWVGVEEGEKVEKWQALASLDQRELQKKLKQELLDFMDTRWDFEQTRDDYDVESNNLNEYSLSDPAKRVLQQSQFTLDRSVLDVEIQNIALEYATLVSPIQGIVTKVEAPHPGINITPANAEIEVANPEKLQIAAEVDEIDIGKVHQQQPTTITFDAYPEEEFKTLVENIEFTPTSTRGGGTAYIIELPLAVENKNQKYKLGMNADLELLVEEKKDVLTIPIEALKEKNGKTKVEVLEKGTINSVPVETGMETEYQVEIKQGLKKGQKVVLPQKD